MNDPQHSRIVATFGINEYPVVVVTAIDQLASLPDGEVTAFVRLDSKHLLASSERTVETVQELFNLFISGQVAEAVSRGKWAQRLELLKAVGGFVGGALKKIGGFVADRDFSVSVVEGKFELKRSGG